MTFQKNVETKIHRLVCLTNFFSPSKTAQLYIAKQTARNEAKKYILLGFVMMAD